MDDFIEKPKVKAKAKAKAEAKPEFVFDEAVHPAGELKPIQIQLTEDDLDPTKDKELAPLFEFATREDLANYFQMPSLRGIVNYIHQNRNQLAIDYANYKKRGRIK